MAGRSPTSATFEVVERDVVQLRGRRHVEEEGLGLLALLKDGPGAGLLVGAYRSLDAGGGRVAVVVALLGTKPRGGLALQLGQRPVEVRLQLHSGRQLVVQGGAQLLDPVAVHHRPCRARKVIAAPMKAGPVKCARGPDLGVSKDFAEGVGVWLPRSRAGLPPVWEGSSWSARSPARNERVRTNELDADERRRMIVG
jgi:hypothetical protein